MREFTREMAEEFINNEHIYVPEGVTDIGEWCFHMFYNVKEITLPNTLKKINYMAFSACINLKTIIIPDGVKVIEKHAFTNSGLINITLPDSITYIDNNAFTSCFKLKTIYASRRVAKMLSAAKQRKVIFKDGDIDIYEQFSNKICTLFENNNKNINVEVENILHQFSNIVKYETMNEIGEGLSLRELQAGAALISVPKSIRSFYSSVGDDDNDSINPITSSPGYNPFHPYNDKNK